jgi:hypothetical protein
MTLLNKYRGRCSAAQLKLWIESGWSRGRIAARIGCSGQTVVNLCRSFDLPIPLTLEEQRAVKPKPARTPSKPRHDNARQNAGAVASMSADPERDALTNGDVDEAKANRILAARYAEVRENHWELSRLVNVGEGDEADEQEKSLRHSLACLRTFNTALARQCGPSAGGR